jgi:pilus assembly protein Flp/PilA
MTQMLMKLWKDEEGPTAVEYAVMVAVIALVVILGAQFLGTQVSTTFQNAGSRVPGGAAPAAPAP